MHSSGTYMLRTKIISVYKRMRRSPNKVFVGSDFPGINGGTRRYLNLLETLNLIERVNTFYNVGVRGARREVVGWRIVKKRSTGETTN